MGRRLLVQQFIDRRCILMVSVGSFRHMFPRPPLRVHACVCVCACMSALRRAALFGITVAHGSESAPPQSSTDGGRLHRHRVRAQGADQGAASHQARPSRRRDGGPGPVESARERRAGHADVHRGRHRSRPAARLARPARRRAAGVRARLGRVPPERVERAAREPLPQAELDDVRLQKRNGPVRRPTRRVSRRRTWRPRAAASRCSGCSTAPAARRSSARATARAATRCSPPPRAGRPRRSTSSAACRRTRAPRRRTTGRAGATRRPVPPPRCARRRRRRWPSGAGWSASTRRR